MSLPIPCRVAVLFGGIGAEAAVSCASAASILCNGRPSGVLFTPIGIDRDGRWFIYRGPNEAIADGQWRSRSADLMPTFPLRLNNRRGFIDGEQLREVDVVLPVLHGDGGEDGTVQGALTCVGLPFVGADTRTGAITTDKAVTKALATAHGVPVLPFLTLPSDVDAPYADRQLHRVFGPSPYPVFVKPTSVGSSVGASAVVRYEQLAAALADAAPFGEILIEPRLDRPRELEVGYLGGCTDGELSEIAEIVSQTDFFSFEEKYLTHTATVLPRADLSPSLRETVLRYASAMVRATGLRDLGRIDFFLTREGALYFNEINAFPGCTEDSLYPQMFAARGLPLPALIEHLLCRAYARRI